MAQKINNNSVLGATGTIYEGKVQHLQGLNLNVIDNGGGSTITFSSGTDGVTYGSTPQVYKADGTALGGATTTAKGRYYVDLRGINYVKIAVTTYVSGKVITDVDEAAGTVLGKVLALLQTGITAQGSTQAGAWPIQAKFNQFSTVGASTGAILPAGVAKADEVVVKNNGASTLTVYPPVGYAINGGSANAGVSVAASAQARFVSDGVGNFWTFGA
jgi:hypothetical protein